MQYSPKLKIAMEEIKTILKKHDIAGVVILHTVEGEAFVTPDSTNVFGFSEYLYHINTSYSAAKIENDRFKLLGKAAHYASKKQRDIKVAGAVIMLDHLETWTGNMAMQIFEFKKRVDEIVDKIDDGDGGESTSHSQQNN